MQIYKSKSFNYSQNFKEINFREHPELYEIGRGEQGVLLVEPYKSEILPYWRFKTQAIARESAKKIYELFLEYKEKNDFVGMDMARKFLQMGYTRSRRYANHKSGKKYLKNPQNELTKDKENSARKNTLPQEIDWDKNEKAKAAREFYSKYKIVKEDKKYIELAQLYKNLTNH